jgi:AraC-like DNA-binding protein
MDLAPGYRELPAPGGLACLWVRVAGPEVVEVLPDGCSDLIWQAGHGAFVAGPDTRPAPVAPAAGEVFVGARFRPGAGGPALGLPLSELRDRRVALAELDRRLAEALPPDLEPEEALRRLAALAARTPAGDPAIGEAARRLADPRTRVATLAADLGLSERQLRRRCDAAAGYGPKTLQRVLRFRGFLHRAGEGGDLARIALECGYADQAHLTRECGRLAGRTPAALIRA